MKSQPTVEYGSDLVMSLLLESGIDTVTFNPGFSVKGLMDSLAHFGDVLRPVMCPHEGVAVAAAHAYAKATGKPMAVILHNIVGLQNGTMAIFDAWCDRVPMLILGGTGPLAKEERRPWIDWIHSANDQGAQIRDYIKWDDQPVEVNSIPESFWRAWQTASAVPEGPTYVCFDIAVQDAPVTESVPRHWRKLANVPTAPALACEHAQLVADALKSAQSPVIITDFAGDTLEGFQALRKLAELVECPVIDCGARFNFPTDHHLNFSFIEDKVLPEADLVLALDVEDRDGRCLSLINPDATVIWISPAHLRIRAWAQDYLKLPRATTQITSAAGPALKSILAKIDEHPPTPDLVSRRKRRFEGVVDAARRDWRSINADGGISGQVLASALGKVLDNADWTLVTGSLHGWERKLIPMSKHRAHLGGEGGGGCGYMPGAAIGGALGIAKGDIPVAIIADGDLLFCPAALWTIANQNLPILMVMNNNAAYENTMAHGRRVAAKRGRPESNALLGNEFKDPAIDFVTMARSYSIEAFGPVTEQADLDAALRAALEVVKSGRPALVDVHTKLSI